MISVEYPAVLGSPVAGLIEAVGPDVTKVASGDRIVCATKIFTQKKAMYGGTQRYTLADESEAIKVSWHEGECQSVNRSDGLVSRLATLTLLKQLR